MILQESVFATKMTLAEAAVAYYALSSVLAVFVRALYLLGWHAAAQREGQVECGFFLDTVVG